jgi:cellulose synthase/poly-beta-1,6-N-acetylglucosamine synthase-like glycosyltransferase
MDTMPTPEVDIETVARTSPDGVSVVVCTRDRHERLRVLLEILRTQESRDCEIIVVDNSPTLGTAASIARHAKARYVIEPRRGIRFARNAGFRAAQADIIAFIDDDCIPDPRWLTSLVSGFTDPKVGGCTGAILPMEVRTEAQRLLEFRGGFNRGFERRIYAATGPEAASLCLPLHAWQCGSGANMAFRKSVLDAIGGFDEVLPTAEDIDAFFRVMREGYRIVYEPAAAVRHDHPADNVTLRRRMFTWGHGYISYLLRIVTTDRRYRRAAMQDILNWFSYQTRRRLWSQIRGKDPYPISLTAREIWGGITALAVYWQYPFRARLRRRPRATGWMGALPSVRGATLERGDGSRE